MSSSSENERALERLGAAWRRRPSAVLADAIRRLDAHVGGWSIELDSADALEACLPRAPDPRLSAAVMEVLTDLRPARSGTADDTRDLWLRCAEVLEQLDDPALLALRDAEAPWNSDWNVGGLTLRMDFALSELEKRYPEGAPAVDEEGRALLAELAPLLDVCVAPAVDDVHAQLLAAIYAAPDEDGPRLVYADWLMDRGDERGELIQLQVESPLDEEAVARGEVLHTRAKACWVGPLAPVVSAPHFRRGFVASVTLDWMHRGNIRRLGAHPAWATVEDVAFPPRGDEGSLPQHLDRSVMTALRRLEHVDESGVRAVCGAAEPWRLRYLSVTADTLASMRLLEETTSLPELTELWLLGDRSSVALKWLWRAGFRVTLEDLFVSVSGRRDLWAVQREASRLPRLMHLTVRVSETSVRLSRGPEHRFTHAEIEGPAREILEILEVAPEYAFTHLAIDSDFTDAQMLRIDDAAARQRGLDDIVVHGHIAP